MLHIHNIYIVRSNLVSLRNLDAHLMGQVQVIDEDTIYGGFMYSTTYLPLLALSLSLSLSLSLRQGMNVVHLFVLFRGA